MLRAENTRLRGLLRVDRAPTVQAPLPAAELGGQRVAGGLPYADRDSSPQQKITLFRALFVGRADVYATPWVSTRTGKKGWSPAEVDRWSTRADTDREFLPLSDVVIAAHLRGDDDPRNDVHVGLYPMLPDDTCHLLAVDFDGRNWADDATAYWTACAEAGVPAAAEVLSVMGAFAEFERALILECQREGIAAAKAARRVHRPQCRPHRRAGSPVA